MFYNSVVNALSEYLVLGDLAKLNEAIALIEGEREAPSFCACQIKTTLTVLEIDRMITGEGSMKFRLTDPGITIEDGTLETGKYVRVFASDQAEGTCLILKVTFTQGDVAVLVPVTPL